MTSIKDLLRAACPLIGGIGPAFYFAKETLVVGREHGLDGFRFYFLGRGGVLGDVEAAVVASAFGYFNPDLVQQMWDTARASTDLSPRDAGRLYLGCCHDFGRRHLAGVSGLAEFCTAAEAVNDAADRTGLALYAGIAAEPLPDDLPARAMQLVAVLREHRGSAHLIAVLTTPGIDPRTAHGIRRPEFWTTFGYDASDLPEPTEAGRAALAAADELTDRLVGPAFDVLDAQARSNLLSGLEAIQQVMPERAAPTAG